MQRPSTHWSEGVGLAHKQHAIHDELVAKLEDGYMLLAHPPAEWRHDVDVDGLTKPT